MAQSKYLRPIRRGEYDLANISLVGADPLDGRPYEDCHDEWQREFDSVVVQRKMTRWWQIATKVRLRLQIAALSSHLGMS